MTVMVNANQQNNSETFLTFSTFLTNYFEKKLKGVVLILNVKNDIKSVKTYCRTLPFCYSWSSYDFLPPDLGLQSALLQRKSSTWNKQHNTTSVWCHI